MIKIYTGTPGSGKSLHVMRLVVDYLRSGKNVISNFPILHSNLKRKDQGGRFYYLPNSEITVDYLYQFNSINHVKNKESQTLLIIDEASVKFNCRQEGGKGDLKERLKFCTFFAQHRKFGFNVVLVSQNMRQIDRQIRDLIEIEVVHRKLNNFSVFVLLPFAVFVAVEKNVAMKEKNDHDFFLYSRYYGTLYDTYYDFSRIDKFNDQESLIKQIEESLLYAHTDNKKTNKKVKVRKNLIMRCRTKIEEHLRRARGCPPGGAPGSVWVDEDERDDVNTIFDDYKIKHNEKVEVCDL